MHAKDYAPTELAIRIKEIKKAEKALYDYKRRGRHCRGRSNWIARAAFSKAIQVLRLRRRKLEKKK